MSASDVAMPSTSTWFSVPSMLKFEYSRPPATMPTHSELYTSLVISASAMAMIGGSSDQKVW